MRCGFVVVGEFRDPGDAQSHNGADEPGGDDDADHAQPEGAEDDHASPPLRAVQVGMTPSAPDAPPHSLMSFWRSIVKPAPPCPGLTIAEDIGPVNAPVI